VKQVDTLIIGGGITGLSAASFLGKDSDYLILEGAGELGGYCKTTKRNGFVWDYSGHFFHFRNDEIKKYMMSEMACDVVTVKKITDIDYKGNVIDFPFQYNIHQLPKEDFLECLRDMYYLGDVNNENFKSFVNSTSGEAIAQKFLIPYNEKLYACDLNKLDADAMGRFFPKPIKFDELMEKITAPADYESYNGTFIYPVDGSYEFIKSILKRVDENKIWLNSKANRIDTNKKIVYTDRGEVQYKNLISTMPFNKLLPMVSDEPNDNLSSNKVAVFNLGFDKGTDIETHWRYFPGNEVFYRIGFYNNILGTDKLSLYVEVGAKSNDILDETLLLNKILADLKESGVITDHKLVDHQFIVMDPAYVHITKESEKSYKNFCNYFNNKGIYSIGRYGSWTYCSIEDNIIQAKELIGLLYNNIKTKIN
jgi:protoporphyrinogen oxidase